MIPKMNQLMGSSVGGIKYLVYPLTRMITLIQARSFVNCKVCESNRQGETEDFLSFFTKKAQRINDDDHTEIYYGPVFTGDVEKRYLDYLRKLDWDSLQNHMIDYPRIRSENEARVIFDKWAAHFGRKYPSPELKEMRFPAFKKKLDSNDQSNSRGYSGLGLWEKDDILHYPFTCFGPTDEHYLVRGFGICYRSFTRPDFCELSGTYDEDYALKLIKRSKANRLGR